MKKSLLIFLSIIMCVCFVACGEIQNGDIISDGETIVSPGKTNIEENEENEGNEESETEKEEIMSMGNPVHESSHEEILSLDGIDLQIPNESELEKVSWVRIVTSDGVIDEVSFYYDYSFFVCRAKKTDALEDISGMYYEWDYVSSYNLPNAIIPELTGNESTGNESTGNESAGNELAENEVVVGVEIQDGAPTIFSSAEGPGMIIGYKDGYSYSVAMPVESDDEKLVSMWKVFAR